LIDIDHDSGPECSSERTIVARIEHECCECDRTIEKGEAYELVRGKWDGMFNEFKTCMDCQSAKEVFCCSFIYTRLWEDLRSILFETGSELPSADCMMSLTKRARDMMCDLLEECWEEEEV
jgi:hypothetical protein